MEKETKEQYYAKKHLKARDKQQEIQMLLESIERLEMEIKYEGLSEDPDPIFTPDVKQIIKKETWEGFKELLKAIGWGVIARKEEYLIKWRNNRTCFWNGEDNINKEVKDEV